MYSTSACGWSVNGATWVDSRGGLELQVEKSAFCFKDYPNYRGGTPATDLSNCFIFFNLIPSESEAHTLERT